MSTGAVIVIVVAAAVVVVALILTMGLRARSRSRGLQEQFGPEYDRALARTGNRKSAERELSRRVDERQQLDLRAMSPSDRDRHAQEWRRIQADFVDSPTRALAQADTLLTDVMRARGYAVEDFTRRADLLSVDHPQLVTPYRQAHEIRTASESGEVSTEHARQAFVAYRELFAGLLELPADRQEEANRR